MKVIEIIQELFSPLGFVWMVLIISAVMSFRRQSRFVGVMASLAALVMAVVGNIGLARTLVVEMESSYQKIDINTSSDIESRKKVDAVVVINWANEGIENASRPDTYASGGERLILGAELVARDKAEFIIVPDIHLDGLSAADAIQSNENYIFEKFGLKKRQVIRIPGAAEMYEQAQHVAQLARANKWKSIQVVASAIEMDRATAVFEKIGLEVEPVACEFQTFSSTPVKIGQMNIIPDAHAVNAITKVIQEKMKIRRYKVRGWI